MSGNEGNERRLRKNKMVMHYAVMDERFAENGNNYRLKRISRKVTNPGRKAALARYISKGSPSHETNSLHQTPTGIDICYRCL